MSVIKPSWLIVCIAALSMATSVQAEEKTYVLNTSTGAPYTNGDRTGFQDLVVTEVFRRIGLKAKVVAYDASARALVNANMNVDDGVAMRIKSLDKKYPNLIRVEEPIIENQFVAYSKGLDLTTDSWQSLEPYTVSHIHGWLIFERNLRPEQKKSTVSIPKQMFTMLDKGRTDLVLYELWQGLQRAKDSHINVKVHKPPLASVNMYMFVHKNHVELAPRLAQSLREMKEDGTYQEIFDRAFKPLLQ